jgi:hypothetical protein
MSATLTWASSGLATKTGTTAAACFSDLKDEIDSHSADAEFFWEVVGSELATTPYYLNLGRKDASAGRISIICWTSAPAGNNSAILGTAPATNQLFIAWFPDGTGTTLSNLTASSGTINGDDTDCVKVSASATFSSMYGANFQWFYFDSAEGVVFGTQNPAATSIYWLGAGDLVVDAADTAYGCTFGTGTSGSVNQVFGTTALWPWSAANTLAGTSSNQNLRTNYGSADRQYYQPCSSYGAWTTQTAGSANDILVDGTNTYAYFFPQPLVASQVKGGGFPLKLRQICGGPTTPSAFYTYSTTGPVAQATQFCAATSGSTGGAPWMVNFKI